MALPTVSLDEVPDFQETSTRLKEFVDESHARVERQLFRVDEYTYLQRRNMKRRMGGLLDRLAVEFYPRFEAKRRHRNSSSCVRGKSVEEQLEVWMRRGRPDPHLKRTFPRRGKDPEVTQWDLFTKRVAQWFHDQGMVPLYTQVPVFNESQQILTYIDIVGIRLPRRARVSLDPRDLRCQVFMCELKTGFDIGYQRASQPGVRMLAPLETLLDSQANQHQLQLSWMQEHVHDKDVFHQHFILRMNSKLKRPEQIDLKRQVTRLQPEVDKVLTDQRMNE